MKTLFVHLQTFIFNLLSILRANYSLILFWNNHSIYTYPTPFCCLAEAPKTYIMSLLG